MLVHRGPYRRAASGAIDCEVQHPLMPELGWLPFTADPNDPEDYGRELFAFIEAELQAQIIAP